MRFLDFVKIVLFESRASDAATQAHDMGLSYAGYGKWKDQSGKTVAKTVKGNLVRLEPGETPGTSSPPTTSPQKTPSRTLHKNTIAMIQALSQIGHEQHIPPQATILVITDMMRYAEEDDIKEMARRVKRIYAALDKAKSQKVNVNTRPSWFPTPEENQEYRNPAFGSYKNRPVLTDTFSSLVGKSPTDTEAGNALISTLMKTMNVSPKTSVVKTEFEEVAGITMEGQYDASLNQISISDASYDRLQKIPYFSQEEIHQLTHGQEDTPEIEQKLEILRGVHVLIHEMCHAKDSSIPNIVYNDNVLLVPPRIEAHKKLLEGLNETIARQLTWSCFNADPKERENASKAYKKVMNISTRNKCSRTVDRYPS
jgi:hypothetical protein